MPQGKRKVPFSSKQKKLQLQQRRERKQESTKPKNDTTLVSSASSQKDSFDDVEVINEQPTTSAKQNTNRYRFVFKKEKNEEIKQRIAAAQETYNPVPEESLEVSYEEVFVPGSELDMPKRPPWDHSVGKEILEAKEHQYFRVYLANLESRFQEQDLSHFEMNLETWRQLWRVLEFSDIVLLVTDIRYPVYHFSPALYDYVTKELKKHMILVLNKIDLVPAPLVLAWQEYFKKHFPAIKVMCFASYAGMILKEGKRGRRVGNLHMAVAGARNLLKLCEEIVNGQVDLSSWKAKIDTEANQICADGEAYVDADSDDDQTKNVVADNDTSAYTGEHYSDNILTVGFVGHPNVGKSSFLNAVCGKKVVSVSRTPGHTKHYQTIMLTKNVRLCDCPGLVFPSLVPKPLQVLMGCYPIAQLRVPYTAIRFLGQRTPLQNILNLHHPSLESGEKESEVAWSAFDICEAWAIKRGFHTAKTSRPDVYRAANNILRMALDGRTICLAFYPPNYTKEKNSWSTHPALDEVIAIQSHRQKNEESHLHGMPADVRLMKVSYDTEEFDSESEDEDSRNDEADSEDSAPSSENQCDSSQNRFDLLWDDFVS